MRVSVSSLVRTVMIGGLLFAWLAGLAAAAPPTFVYRDTSDAPDVAFGVLVGAPASALISAAAASTQRPRSFNYDEC